MFKKYTGKLKFLVMVDNEMSRVGVLFSFQFANIQLEHPHNIETLLKLYKFEE
jgi:hypothetical protein